MYDCVADHHDELTFNEGEVLVVLGEDDADWWVSMAISTIQQFSFLNTVPLENLFMIFSTQYHMNLLPFYELSYYFILFVRLLLFCV